MKEIDILMFWKLQMKIRKFMWYQAYTSVVNCVNFGKVIYLISPLFFSWIENYPLSLSNILVPGDGTTISAKPQIRNIRAEVTKLVPTALRVRRDDAKLKGKKPATAETTNLSKPTPTGSKPTTSEEPTKDDVYMNFMKEMEGFL